MEVIVTIVVNDSGSPRIEQTSVSCAFTYQNANDPRIKWHVE
jgi:hypothetical protein